MWGLCSFGGRGFEEFQECEIMKMIQKNLNYFFKFMPHEEGKDASPSQITEMNDIHPQIEAIVEYLEMLNTS